MSAEPIVFLRAHHNPRVEGGHPWVYATEIDRVEGLPTPGGIVRVASRRGRAIGRGYYNQASAITVRLLSRGEEPLEEGWIARRLERALAWRRRWVGEEEAFRLAFGEADDLPGLVVDVYGRVAVFQLSTLGMEVRREEVAAALREVLGPSGLWERSDMGVRRHEGLGPRSALAWGEVPERVPFREDGLEFEAQVQAGQKTGFFLDQRESRRAAGRLMGGRVLDCFCYAGAFGLRLARAGAKVFALDISAPALAAAGRHAGRNELGGRLRPIQGNAFDMLRAMEHRGALFDGVVLDPPALAPGQAALEKGVRAYKELNLRAMRLVREGGVLLTCSCSARLAPPAYLDMLREAAQDAGRALTLLWEGGQPPDHPVRLAIPETRYLKASAWAVRRL
ncbi:MAG: class I SAM-dependent rRNA methyltransferase [Nitrospinota bacterium]